MPGPDQDCWLSLIQMLIHSDRITFRRCTQPADAIGSGQLICFFDGSNEAFATVIYVRWQLTDGTVDVSLLCAKPKVTPLKRISTPRSELNGAVIAARLAHSAVRSLRAADVPLERLWFIGDSECTLSSLEKINGAFGEYFGNRVGEIMDIQAQIEKLCPVGNNGEWWYTPSCHNAADQATRPDSSPKDVNLNSSWQSGPSYLCEPPSRWPIDRNFALRKDDCIPQNELLKQFRCMIQATDASPSPSIDQVLSPFSTNNWNKLIRVTQFLLSWFYKVCAPETCAALMLTQSQRLWFLSVMSETHASVKAGRLKELNIQEVDGIVVMQGRASTGMEKFFGNSALPVIMGSTRVAYLIMLDAHCQDHTGRDITLAMSRKTAWIVNAKKLAKQIVRSCIRCRYLRKRLENQKMALLPDILQVPAAPSLT